MTENVIERGEKVNIPEHLGTGVKKSMTVWSRQWRSQPRAYAHIKTAWFSHETNGLAFRL